MGIIGGRRVRENDDDGEDGGMLARFARLSEGLSDMAVEDEERRAAGGRMICPQCEQRSVVERFGDTGEYDSFVECEAQGCKFLEVFF